MKKQPQINTKIRELEGVRDMLIKEKNFEDISSLQIQINILKWVLLDE